MGPFEQNSTAGLNSMELKYYSTESQNDESVSLGVFLAIDGLIYSSWKESCLLTK